MSKWYIASEENIEYLAHYGVKGMKWKNRKRRPVNESANHKTLQDVVDKISDNFTMAKANAKKYIKEKLYNGGEPVNEIKRRAQKAATTAGVVAVGAVGNAVDKVKDIAEKVKKKRKKKK